MLAARPEITWNYLLELEKATRGVVPNRGHRVIAEMDEYFDEVWTITQNVDGLHHRAGSRNVIDIHGDLHNLGCTRCDYGTTVPDYAELTLPPRCPACQGVLRPAVVLFGEQLPTCKLARFWREFERGFDMVFSVGTSSLFDYIAAPVRRPGCPGSRRWRSTPSPPRSRRSSSTRSAAAPPTCWTGSGTASWRGGRGRERSAANRIDEPEAQRRKLYFPSLALQACDRTSRTWLPDVGAYTPRKVQPNQPGGTSDEAGSTARNGSTRRGFLTHRWRRARRVGPVDRPRAGPRPRAGVAASERITLGVIGIGPRCTYDLKSMLAAARRPVRGHLRRPGQPPRGRQDAGRRALREQGLRPLPRLPRAARPQGHRRRADRHRRPLARAGVDPGGAGRQGRLQREALRPHHRRLPGPGRHHAAAPAASSRPARSAAASPTSRRPWSWPTAASSASSTRCTPRSTRLELDNAWLPAEPTPPRDVVDWDLWLGPAPWRPYNQAYVNGQLARLLGLRLRAPGCSTGAPTPSTSASGPTRPTTPCRSSTSRRPTNITARYANGVKLVLDFLKTPFGDRPGWINHLGTCPVRFVGDEGWVETGDSGGIEVQPGVAQERAEGAGGQAGDVGPGRLGPRPQLLRLHQVAAADRRPTRR